MRRPLGAILVSITATIGLVVGFSVPAHAVPAPPSVMAAVGDSITRAFNVTSGRFLVDTPAESWATGTDPAVASQSSRLLQQNPALAGHIFNDAKTGAKMSALAGQLAIAAGQNADYVTVLMGANDVCATSVAAMTPTSTFMTQFDSALASFTAARPDALVSVSSIPNLYQLWSVLHTNSRAQSSWNLLGTCRNMLSSRATEAQRQQVLAQLNADNAVLGSVCAKYPTCRFDGGAVFNVAFTGAQVSTLDYFHPSVSGQAVLAEAAWRSSPFGS